MPPARRVLILVPLLMAAALIGTVLASYVSVHRVLETLARGQGDAMLDSIRHGRSEDPEFLTTLLEEQWEEGLRCIAVFDPQVRPVRTMGECVTDDPEELRRAVLTSGPDEAVSLPGGAEGGGGRVRMVRGGPRPDDPPGVVRSRGAILVEFEPILTRQLEAGAVRSLGIGGAASLALVLFAVGLWRLTVREERMKEAMERDRRLASLGEMAAVLAHEIRNPLTSMKGHAQLLAESLPPESRERAKADRVVGEAVRLERLTSDLLGFVRSGEIEPRAVSPAEVLRSAAGEVDGERVELDLSGAPESWHLDPRLVRQALTNLMRNALQAADDGEEAAAAVEVENGSLVFSVRDRGPGVPAEDRERIFEPFYTTRTRGTGLGLAVARRIVELHGGSITTAEDPGGGAVFRAIIPRSGGRS